MLMNENITLTDRSGRGILTITAFPQNAPSHWGLVPRYKPELLGKWLVAVAVDNDGTIAPFSNGCGDAKYWCLAAPGVDIPATGWDGTLTVRSGTEYSAAHISGALALLKSRFPDMPMSVIAAILINTAKDLGVEGVDDIYGHGLINISAAINVQNSAHFVLPEPPPPPPTTITQQVNVNIARNETDLRSVPVILTLIKISNEPYTILIPATVTTSVFSTPNDSRYFKDRTLVYTFSATQTLSNGLHLFAEPIVKYADLTLPPTTPDNQFQIPAQINAPNTLDGVDYRSAEFMRSPNLAAINADAAYQRGYFGQGVTVAVIDAYLHSITSEFAGRLPALIPGTANLIPEELKELNEGTRHAAIIGAARNNERDPRHSPICAYRACY